MKKKAEYKKMCDRALAEYEKIRDPAMAEYEKIRGPAWEVMQIYEAWEAS